MNAKKLIDEPAVRFGISTAVLLGTGGLVFLAGKTLFKKTVGEIKEQSALKQTTTVGKGPYFAEQLQLAFTPSSNSTVSRYFGDGTDEAGVLKTLRDIPDKKTWLETQRAYKILYDRTLNDDLKDELTSVWGNEDYNAAVQIINSKK